MKIIIIGNSAASTAAVESIRKYDQQSSITQFTDEPHSLYSRSLLSYYLAGTIDKRELFYRDPDFHKEANIDLNAGKSVIAVDPEGQQVKCNDGRSYHYDKLLISTGSSAKIPANIPKNINGVFVLRTMDDAEAIKKCIPQAKNAVILGGGLIGMRAAYALNKCGLHVSIVVRSQHVLSQMIDGQSAQILKKRLEENGIKIYQQTDVSEIISKNNKLVSIKTDQAQTVDCELLIVAKGTVPNTALIRDTDIARRRGIKTNLYMQTNYENIFAAGDVAEAYDIATEDYAINALWTCAVQQGCIAGLNICDRKTAYNGTLGMNALSIFNIPVISFGITKPEDETKYKIISDLRQEQNIYKKFVIQDNRIKGLILVGKIANAGVFLSLIKNKTDVSAFAAELLSDHFNFGKLLKYDRKPALEKYYDSRLSNRV